MTKCLIAASILSANFACLGQEINDVIHAGADIIHFDVMDNHYVPNITIGPTVLKAIRDYGINSIIDVHLMTKPVDNLIIPFAQAGADYITFHPENTYHVDRSINLIKQCGCKVGLALTPTTPLSYLDYVLEKIDIILIMAVNPGYAGQTFLPVIYNKIQNINNIVKKQTNKILLSVDGGININNISKIVICGANILVIGSFIFNNTMPYIQTIKYIKKKIFIK
ncbi:ribulose-phosphate 3-epimerase [Enterobacteriaceae endosymbiont of Macroplea appendiculata]|uniref:ribulose-phosphate 3-epimerase n=1 Tax=Enterobacteriaceae endosymbiont of Macroplea appendiculata TaxID=2675790 RepID=UPI001448EB4F|nr:ribulose-phosphate 3-epimerase [Enterobacteriaceae endosymbiont of Macroplea appendiculata]QJC30945.1 ribulose-phosphate 3-epimerase [Enterobacteriaceae endosymbiont of Macroplea appendiculata]